MEVITIASALSVQGGGVILQKLTSSDIRAYWAC